MPYIEGQTGLLQWYADKDDAVAGIPAQVATIAVPRWKPSTVYAAGQMVTLPTGDNATAIAAHTSGPSTHTPANWALSTVLNSTFARRAVSSADELRSLRDVAYRPFYAQLGAGGCGVYILGHSVVNGSSSSVYHKAFPTIVKEALRAIDPLAVVGIAGNPGQTSTQILAQFAGVTANQNATYTSLVVFMGLLNDFSLNVNPATTQANLTSLVAKMKLIQPTGKDTPGFLIVTEWLRGDVPSPAYPWTSYLAAAKAVADADQSVTVLDLSARMGPANAANVNGFYNGDLVHPTDKGHRAIADAVLTEILPTNGFRGPVEKSRVSLIQIDPKMGPATTVAGSWATVVNSAYLGNGVYYNSSNQQNDATNYDVVLAPGTWSFDIMHAKNTNGCVVTVSLDDGYGAFTDVGTIDTYAAAAAYNVVASLNGIIITGSNPLRRRLRLTATSRNAANTTGWYLNLQSIQLRRYV